MISRFLGGIVAFALTSFTRLITGAQARWIGCAPVQAKRVYFGNHVSHADFVLIWASLPPELRRMTRPVAGADYWNKGAIRSYLIHQVLNGVLIDRERKADSPDPIEVMAAALEGGDCLIIFPEGTRNTTEEVLLPFKSGLYHLAKRFPKVELVPVWVENQGRVLPKGETVPVPLLCTVNFGTPLEVGEAEGKQEFLDRARNALLGLAAVSKPQ
jgi:1-acyl-sn-glycerol-3-phosphate acyltransferase